MPCIAEIFVKIERIEQVTDCRVCKPSFAMLGNVLHGRKHGKIRRKEQLTDCRVCKTLENETCHMASRYLLHFNVVASSAMLGNALRCRKHSKIQRNEQLIGFAGPHSLCSGMFCTAESMVKYREMNN